MKQNKKCKQTLESAQCGLQIIVNCFFEKASCSQASSTDRGKDSAQNLAVEMKNDQAFKVIPLKLFYYKTFFRNLA